MQTFHFRKRKGLVSKKKKQGVVLTKRRKFFLVAIVLMIGLFIIQNLPVERRFLSLAMLAMTAYVLSAWSLFRDLRGIEWFSCLLLPSVFPVAVGLFYFLLPQAAFVKWVVLFLFSVSMYAILLTANIFSVASIRTIQLLRAARAVGFLFTILTATFLYHLILSFKLQFWWNALMVFVVSWLLFLQSLWSLELDERGLSLRVLKYSLAGALAMMEGAVVVSFLPVEVALGSLFLSMSLYVILGIMQHFFEEKLFKRTINEYLFFGILAGLIIGVASLMKWWN